MTKLRNRLRAAPLALAALTLLALPTVAAAQAEPPSRQMNAAKSHPKRHVATTHQRQYGSGEPRRCAWPYQNRFPPCMSTWPAGSPSYHGPVPGVTFDDE